MSLRLRLAWGAAIVSLTLLPALRAVIFYSTADLNHNTTAPTGNLANSGWQWVGAWTGFQGTPIGPHHFLTARHVGGTVGDAFVLNGVTYVTTAFFDDKTSDLRICQITGTFPSWAPLYRADNEVGRQLVVFGRGWTRGAEVRDAATNALRGWQWSTGDGKLRWGENAIVAEINGGPNWGPLLYAVFNAKGGPNVAHLAYGDSSGPVFINDGAGWKLAGIAASVDSAFSTTAQGPGFNAAIFDRRGLYYGSGTQWKLVSGSLPVPSGFYSTRISARAAWIDGVLAEDPAGNAGSPAPNKTVELRSEENEQAVTDRDGAWRPPQRYRMMLTMAALGNPDKQFQLGAALVQEQDEAAKAEGLKWLERAAAQGCRSAKAALAQGREVLVRNDRDRDKVRVSRCCPVPGR